MKIAFAGKGGSGKTTLSSLFTRHLAARGLPVVAIDADINQHLAEALGAAADPPPMGAYLPQIKEYLRGSNPRITSAAAMVKTTPPGRGSRLLRPGGPDPVHDLAITTPCGARLLATGPFGEEDLGVACYHAKTGAVELYLNHLADGPGEYVVVDCTAGADSFASGLVRARARGAGHGAGPPVRPDRSQRADQGRARRRARHAGHKVQGLGQVRPPGRGVPPEECPGLGQRRDRPGPRRPDRPRLHPRPSRGHGERSNVSGGPKVVLAGGSLDVSVPLERDRRQPSAYGRRPGSSRSNAPLRTPAMNVRQ